MRNDAPIALDVPSPERDRPGWVKVGVIAAVGFIVGIAWPRLVGIRLGPSAPGEGPGVAASSQPSARVAEATTASAPRVARGPINAAPAAAPAASASAVPTPAAATTLPVAAAGPSLQVNVQRGAIMSCRTDDGDAKKGKECGSVPQLDALVGPRLRRLSSCAAAEGQSGKLSVVVTADFANNRLGWDVGKSSTIGNLEGLNACLKTQLHGVALSGISHEHARYTVNYAAHFGAGEARGETRAKSDTEHADHATHDAPEERVDPKPAREAPAAAGGEATVAWEVALVRDVPKTGQIVARLPRGTKVKVGASMKDGWYSVKFGDGFASDGWLYRGSIGR